MTSSQTSLLVDEAPAQARRIAVITGGRDRTPTLLELERLAEVIGEQGFDTVRHGDCRGTDKSVGAWVRARGLANVERWPAEDYGRWPACGPIRNCAMLDGSPSHRKHPSAPQPADLLIRFAGNRGTARCTRSAVERRTPIEPIDEVSEPRPWNRHHGVPPVPAALRMYIGRGTPLGNIAGPVSRGLSAAERAEKKSESLGLYRRWLWAKVKARDQEVLTALDAITPEHYLICSCWPMHCHSEIVIRAWRWRNRKPKP